MNKPLYLSQRSASSNTGPHQHPREKRQESTKDLGFTSNISASISGKEFTGTKKNGNNLTNQDGVKSELSFSRSRGHSIPKSTIDIPGNLDRSRTKMRHLPEKNSGSKRRQSFVSATDTKKHKSTIGADPYCYLKASEKCIPSTSAGASSNYESQEIGGLNMKSKEKSTLDCEYCGKTLKYKSLYNRHVRSHTGVKPCKCQHCGEGFTLASNLKIHILRHTGDRPFSCNVCQKAYYTKIDLDEHLRTHTGERPYKCGLCNKTFRYRSEISRHKKIHTKKHKRNKSLMLSD